MTTTVVRMTGPQGIAAAVPHALGFQPEHSLVVLCLSEPRGRVGPVMRVDLFSADDSGPVDDIVRCARRYADGVVLLAYHEGDRPACIDAMTAALGAAQVPIGAIMSVSGGRIRDARSRSTFRQDPGIPVLGAADDEVARLHAATVLTGRRPLPSRRALADSIAPPDTADGAAWRAAMARARAEISPVVDAAGTTLTLALSRLTDEVLRFAIEALADGRGDLVTAAARLAVISSHRGSRDQLMARAVSAPDSSIVTVWRAMAAQCPDADAAQICTVLAVAAYRFGDGALAQCAVDRALRAEPEHRMATMLTGAIAACLPPEQLTALADMPIPADAAMARRSTTAGGSRRPS